MNIRIVQLCLTILLVVLTAFLILLAVSGLGSLVMLDSDSGGISAVAGGITSRLVGMLLLIAGAIVLVIVIARGLRKKGT